MRILNRSLYSWVALLIAILNMIISLQLYKSGYVALTFLLFMLSGISIGGWIWEGNFNQLYDISKTISKRYPEIIRKYQQEFMGYSKEIDTLKQKLEEKIHRLEKKKRK